MGGSRVSARPLFCVHSSSHFLLWINARTHPSLERGIGSDSFCCSLLHWFGYGGRRRHHCLSHQSLLWFTSVQRDLRLRVWRLYPWRCGGPSPHGENL